MKKIEKHMKKISIEKSKQNYIKLYLYFYFSPYIVYIFMVNIGLMKERLGKIIKK